MYAYDTLVEALTELKKRGYTYDFNVKSNSIYCKVLDESFDAGNFEVKEYHHFEGDSDPGDLSEVYAIGTASGIKGVLTDGICISSDLSPEMIQKLQRRL